jgi:hypothetical protein
LDGVGFAALGIRSLERRLDFLTLAIWSLAFFLRPSAVLIEAQGW